MGWVSHAQGDREGARRLLEQGLALARDSGDERTIARTLLFLGDLRLRQGAPEQAAALLQESQQVYQRMADGWSLAWIFGAQGEVARLQGDYERAVAHFHSCLALYRDLDSKPEIPYPLEALALAAADQGQFEQSARLWGAASAGRDAVHALLPPSYGADYAPALERVRAALGEEAFEFAQAEGRALTLVQVLANADSPAEPAPPVAPSADTEPRLRSKPRLHEHGLTPREIEVVHLVSTGLTDAQIAEELVISPRTVGKHLQSVYSKLDLHSRSAATRWAIEHQIG
jgi:DNA-binding CsgD family transcriptional regulator/tetratricopeptide (TPR) repeat protein